MHLVIYLFLRSHNLPIYPILYSESNPLSESKTQELETKMIESLRYRYGDTCLSYVATHLGIETPSEAVENEKLATRKTIESCTHPLEMRKHYIDHVIFVAKQANPKKIIDINKLPILSIERIIEWCLLDYMHWGYDHINMDPQSMLNKMHRKDYQHFKDIITYECD